MGKHAKSIFLILVLIFIPLPVAHPYMASCHFHRLFKKNGTKANTFTKSTENIKENYSFTFLFHIAFVRLYEYISHSPFISPVFNILYKVFSSEIIMAVYLAGLSVSPSLWDQQTFSFFSYFYYSLLLFSLVFFLADVCYFHYFPFVGSTSTTGRIWLILCSPIVSCPRSQSRTYIALVREQNFRYEIKINTKGRRQECSVSYLLLWRMNGRL